MPKLWELVYDGRVQGNDEQYETSFLSATFRRSTQDKTNAIRSGFL